jgi:hypothetical protein
MEQLGADKKDGKNDNEIIFNSICHHSSSYKLYYYKDSKTFMCYSCCGCMSLFDVVIGALDLKNDSEGFKEAFKYVCNFKNISFNGVRKKGFKINEKEDKDLDFLKLHKTISREKSIKLLPSYNDKILQIFDNYFPIEWENEGICKSSGERFGIKIYFSQMQIIIPHRDIRGELVGIRCRNYKNSLVDNGMKYIPIEIEGLTYKYPMSFNLYGIYQNKENIKKTKRVIIAESEKSSLISDTFFGQDNNITLATCGMNFTKYQRDLLLSLGVTDIIIAFDKQYELDKLDYYENISIKSLTIEQKLERKKKITEYNNYIKKLIKIFNLVNGYMNMYVISCWDERLGYKDSPFDKGKEIFNQLYSERLLVESSLQLEEELIK